MSTKVYVAYQLLNKSDLWPWVRNTRKRAEKNVQNELRSMHANLMIDVNTSSVEYKGCLKTYKTDEKARKEVAFRLMYREYKNQLSNTGRNQFDFDVSLAVRERKGALYIIPRCDMVMKYTLDFLGKRNQYVSDFSYWDNVDKPKKVSDADWKWRGKVWNELDKDWSNHIVVHICDHHSFFNHLTKAIK